MHLKKIEIQGFKSFPEYTLIEFDKGMTAIVGPNGSGKSNVTDAVRWVLGEQSIKTLRGGKMEDVIFNGTQSRRAMNYAEVSITIDNVDGELGIDYSEVQVTRRLYRSGESEYQINHVNCRLKDIVRLFMDTGLGKDGYSIVGQGRIDEILSSRSEDRRKVLEEASGIVKYKVRKDEAERKLLSTEQNLIRIADILSELSDQIAPLEEQAEKARLYHRAYDEWKELDIGLSLFLINRNQAFLSASVEECKVLEDEVRVHEDAIIQLRDRNRTLTEKSSQIEDDLEEQREKRTAVTNEIHELQSAIAVIADRREQLSARIDIGRNDNGNSQSEIERLDKESKIQSDKIQSLQLQHDTYAKELSEKESQMTDMSASLNISQKEQSELRKKAETISDELSSYKEQMQTLSSDLLLMDARVKTLSSDRVALISEKEKLAVQYDGQKTVLNSVDKESKDLANAYSEKQEVLRVMREESSRIVVDIDQKNRERDNVKFRTRTLEELEKSREGYQEPIRRLLSDATKKTDVSSKIVGVLGELIRVPKKYETAIEISLGHAVHNIVTQTQEDASFLIDHLKTNKFGRATFLPIDTIRSRKLEKTLLKDAATSDGYLGVASDLVENDGFLSSIVENILGRIVIVNTLEDAMKIANKSGYSYKIVSLEGDVINPGGSMSGGSIRRNGTGLLGRARELEELAKRSQLLETEISSLDSKRFDLDHNLKDVAREQAIIDEKLQAVSLKKVKAESECGRYGDDIEKITSRILLGEKELEEISSERLIVLRDHEEFSQTIMERTNELFDLREIISRTDNDQKSVHEKMDVLRSDIGNLKISVESIDASLKGATELSEMIYREKNGHAEELKRLLAEREQAKNEVKQLAVNEESKINEKAELSAREEKIADSIKKLMLEKDEIEQQLAGFIDKLSSSTAKLSQFQNEQAKMDAKKDRYVVDVDDLKNRLWEDHEITYDNAQTFCLEIDNPQPIQKRLTELKNELKQIGPVNMNAIEEYQKVNDRFTFMSEQKEDIETAKANLLGVITDLAVEMRQQFVTHFEQINENFKVVFSDLFNGGTADIVLDDQEDVLTCGIDIRAQPPGKRLQSLSLLSGGERCLTAIALLFAILQLRPSPFCVLDEVEAALDDVNVNRFTDFVRRYTAKSQFILVTHRKGTMEACDRMYGVTMQERGISKILSMRLGDS